jgi:WD40 repeat protein
LTFLQLAKFEHAGKVNSVAYSPDSDSNSSHAVSASDDGFVRIWNLKTGFEVQIVVHDAHDTRDAIVYVDDFIPCLLLFVFDCELTAYILHVLSSLSL